MVRFRSKLPFVPQFFLLFQPPIATQSPLSTPCSWEEGDLNQNSTGKGDLNQNGALRRGACARWITRCAQLCWCRPTTFFFLHVMESICFLGLFAAQGTYGMLQNMQHRKARDHLSSREQYAMSCLRIRFQTISSTICIR